MIKYLDHSLKSYHCIARPSNPPHAESARFEPRREEELKHSVGDLWREARKAKGWRVPVSEKATCNAGSQWRFLSHRASARAANNLLKDEKDLIARGRFAIVNI